MEDILFSSAKGTNAAPASTLSENTPLLAVYWDFENIHISLGRTLNERGEFPYARPYGQQPKFVKIQPLMDFLQSLGTVAINRAYADWTYFRIYANDFLRHWVDLFQLFPRGHSTKNSTSIRVSMDILEDVQNQPKIEKVVLISGDSDYISVAQKLRQKGKYVIGIGAKGSVNPYLAACCNEFWYYDNILEAADLRSPQPSALDLRKPFPASQEGSGPESPSLKESADDAPSAPPPAPEISSPATSPAIAPKAAISDPIVGQASRLPSVPQSAPKATISDPETELSAQPVAPPEKPTAPETAADPKTAASAEPAAPAPAAPVAPANSPAPAATPPPPPPPAPQPIPSVPETAEYMKTYYLQLLRRNDYKIPLFLDILTRATFDAYDGVPFKTWDEFYDRSRAQLPKDARDKISYPEFSKFKNLLFRVRLFHFSDDKKILLIPGIESIDDLFSRLYEALLPRLICEPDHKWNPALFSLAVFGDDRHTKPLDALYHYLTGRPLPQ